MVWTWLGRLLMWFGARFAPWLVGLSAAFLAAQFDLLRKFFFWAADAMLGLVVFILNSADIDMPAYNPQSLFASLPGDVLAALVDLRIPEAMVIVIGAYGVRFVLQLIPFTRLGA